MRWRFIEYRVHLWGQPVSHHRFAAWRTSTLNQLLWQYSCVFLLEINRECSAELSCCNKVCSLKSTSPSKTHWTVTVLTPSVWLFTTCCDKRAIWCLTRLHDLPFSGWPRPGSRVRSPPRARCAVFVICVLVEFDKYRTVQSSVQYQNARS